MKFLMIVLAFHFIAEMVGGKKGKQEEASAGNSARHPAEHEIR